MSGGLDCLQLRAEDIVRFIACQTHLGGNTCDFQMESYIWKRRNDGQFVINLRKTWEKLLLAARAIAAIENPADVCVIAARPYGQRGILKFSAHTGATAIAGRYTPGTFTNQIQKAFREPRLLIVVCPHMDHQAIVEASYVNIPIIGLCNTDSSLRLIDIAIPCNNKAPKSIGLMLWMLAREVLILRGQISRTKDEKSRFFLEQKEIMADLYFYRSEEDDKENEQEKAKDMNEPPVEWGQEIAPGNATGPSDQWAPSAGMGGGNIDITPAQPMDWAAETQRASVVTDWQGSATAAPAPAVADEWGGGTGGGW